VDLFGYHYTHDACDVKYRKPLVRETKSPVTTKLKNKKMSPIAWMLYTSDASQNDVKKRNEKKERGTNARKKTKVLEPFETFSPER
jgi:hypothetical protein